MKLFRTLAITAIAVSISFTTVFASGTEANRKEPKDLQKDHGKRIEKRIEKEFPKGRLDKLEKDPIKILESQKERVKSLLEEGKISREKADAIISRIDEKIKRIREFNKLPLDEKKEKLKAGFRKFIEKQVERGKLSREKADELIKKYDKQIEKWDGNGYPGFKLRGHFGKSKILT